MTIFDVLSAVQARQEADERDAAIIRLAASCYPLTGRNTDQQRRFNMRLLATFGMSADEYSATFSL